MKSFPEEANSHDPRLPLFWWSRISPLLYNNNVFHLPFFCTLRVADIKSAVPIISGSLFFKHFPSPGFFILLISSPGQFFLCYFFFFFFITFLSRFPFNSTLYLQNQKGLVMLAKLDWEPKKKKKKKKSTICRLKRIFHSFGPGTSAVSDTCIYSISHKRQWIGREIGSVILQAKKKNKSYRNKYCWW